MPRCIVIGASGHDNSNGPTHCGGRYRIQCTSSRVSAARYPPSWCGHIVRRARRFGINKIFVGGHGA